MITSQFEASEKICCLDTKHSLGCCASKCMAWRWEDATETYDEIVFSTKRADDMGAKGYCGLAGKP